MNDEQFVQNARAKEVASRWLSRYGIQERPYGFSPEQVGQFRKTYSVAIEEVYDLLFDQASLDMSLDKLLSSKAESQLERKGVLNGLTESERVKVIATKVHDFRIGLETPEDAGTKKVMVRQDVLGMFDTTTQKIITASEKRIQDIGATVEKIFDRPGFYAAFSATLAEEIIYRDIAREVVQRGRSGRETRELIDTIQLRARRQRRAAFTTVEQDLIQQRKDQAEKDSQERQKLLIDKEVAKRARLLELKAYQRQLHIDGFAETPSRVPIIDDIREAVAAGKKVLLTGPSGTGKTELVNHAMRSLFGISPRKVSINDSTNESSFYGVRKINEQGTIWEDGPVTWAIRGRDGRGGPVLLDELDRATDNRTIIALKGVLGFKPGQKEVQLPSVQEGETRATVGEDFAMLATANVKSEKHTSALRLDPAIIRTFNAPQIVDFMPADELYDLTLASLLDRRGGVALSYNDANYWLKQLCDAVAWVQKAYKGEPIEIGNGEMLRAVGGASTGRKATIQDAIIDPGRVLGMLEGWSGAHASGMSFEDYVNKELKAFINNGEYSQEDRRYLIEIMMLKGFLRDATSVDFPDISITDAVLDGWKGKNAYSGGDDENEERISKRSRTLSYLRPEQVAQLDPYHSIEGSANAIVLKLVNSPEGNKKDPNATATTTSPIASMPGFAEKAYAKANLSRRVYGEEALQMIENKLAKAGVNVRFIVPSSQAFQYSHTDVDFAKTHDEVIVLRPSAIEVNGSVYNLTLYKLGEVLKQAGQRNPAFVRFWKTVERYEEQKAEFIGAQITEGWKILRTTPIEGGRLYKDNEREEAIIKYDRQLNFNQCQHRSSEINSIKDMIWDAFLLHFTSGENFPDDHMALSTTGVNDRSRRILLSMQDGQIKLGETRVKINLNYINSKYLFKRFPLPFSRDRRVRLYPSR